MSIPRTVAVAAMVVTSLALSGAAQPGQTGGQTGRQPGGQPTGQPEAPDLAAKNTAAWTGPVITVSGSGEVERKPDFAVVSVGIQAREKSAATASEKAGSAMRSVAKALEELEIPDMQLQTSGVSLNPAYSWQNDGQAQRQTLLGYDASSTLRVRIEDPAKIGTIIDAAVGAGANSIHGISFELKEALQARQEALTMAARAARDKAETLAEALGLELRSVVTATASSDSPPWQPMMSNRAAFAEAAPGLGQGIEPGMVTVRAETTVTFAAVERR
jgi:uncharacterized protein YggE